MDGPNDGDWLNKRRFMPLTLEQRLMKTAYWPWSFKHATNNHHNIEETKYQLGAKLEFNQQPTCQGMQRQIEMVTVRKERSTHSLFSSPIQALTHYKPDRQPAYAYTL
jgi:hypothetical protein